jgi:hypothetical protein
VVATRDASGCQFKRLTFAAWLGTHVDGTCFAETHVAATKFVG